MTSRWCWVLLLMVACDCGGGDPSDCATTADCPAGERCVDGTCRPPCTTDTDCPSGQRCIDRACVPPDGGVPDGGSDLDASRPGCRTDTDCAEGQCIDGVCCPAGSACGDTCCGASETCFANACVVPGAVCVRATDCADGEYCEPALGEPPPPPPAPECLDPPPSGRCLALPPECTPETPPSETCIRDCTFEPRCAGPHPDDPSVCVLDGVEEWRWGPTATEFPNDTDVWSTPVVGRVTDTNCDGSVDLLDPPNLVFVSGDTQRVDLGDGTFTGTCCHCGQERDGSGPTRDGCRRGVLRVLDGRTGTELTSVFEAEPGGGGISGVTPALGDVDHDGVMEIVAVSYEGKITVIEGDGTVRAQADVPLEEFTTGPACTVDADCDSSTRGTCENGHCAPRGFGWGGGLALADLDGDGTVEVAFGRQVYEIAADGSAVNFEWIGDGGRASGNSLSYFVDLAGDDQLELLAGRTAYNPDGTRLWHRSDLPDSFTAVADFDRDGSPEVVHVGGGAISILAGATGATLVGPVSVTGTGSGGPPTVADFDGDGVPEVGVALKDFYSMHDVDLTAGTITERWATPSHDLSSSVTGSTVFDFEGDGVAEVVYNDECFLWVYDGPTGLVRFAAPTTSFTGTEAALVADVDGDGQAEMVVIANGADPRSPQGWDCDVAPWNVPDGVRPAWVPPEGGVAWRGVAVYGDRARSWVGTRPLWNQHCYSVTNVCSSDDDACVPPGMHGEIPRVMRDNWTVPWLNNYRQNVQADGLFDAPDAVLSLAFDCGRVPPSIVGTVRNLGAAVLPAGVEVAFSIERADGSVVDLGSQTTATPLFPGQAAELVVAVPSDIGFDSGATAHGVIVVDPAAPLFQECFDDNNEGRAPITAASCVF